jgi:outer membrane receptor protein involved in Fe transport
MAFVAASGLALAQIGPSGGAKPLTQEEIIQLSQFTVSATGDRGYNAANTVGATRINVAIKNVPISVVSLNPQFLQDTGAISIEQAARYVSGVISAGAPYSGQLTVRGQNTPGASFRDGVPEAISARGALFSDIALTERVEIIKGPAGTLYGSHNSGGIVNNITKVPQRKLLTTIKANAIPEDSTYRVEADTTGALGQPGWAYRFVAAYQDGETVQGTRNDSTAVSPMLAYQAKNGFRFLARYIFQNPAKGTNSYSWFTDSSGRVSTFLPRDQTIAELDQIRENRQNLLDIDLEQPFTIGAIRWSSRLKLRWNKTDSDVVLYEQGQNLYEFLNAAGGVVGNMTNTLFSDPRVTSFRVLTRTRSTVDAKQEEGVANLDLVGDFTTGVATHKLLLYGVVQRNLNKELGFAGPYPGLSFTTYQHQANPAASVLAAPTKNIDNHIQFRAHAFATQDNISLFNERLILVAGLRYDRRTTDNINRVNNARLYGDVRDATTYKYGIVGRPMAPVGLYYNYSETFSPQGLDQVTGRNFPNLEPSTHEFGAKLNFLNDRLIINGAWFDTKTENALVSLTIVDASGATRLTSVPAGRQTVKGWEVDATWSPIDGLDLMFGMGDLKSRTQTGIRARAVPQGMNYRAFAKYTIRTGDVLKGLYFGAGFDRNPDRALDAADTATMSAFSTADTFVGYQLGSHWRAQLNVTNVTDKVAPWIAVARQIIYPVEPRRARLSLSYTF